MRWRLFKAEANERWFEYPGAEEVEAHPADWGLELPEGAKVHSVAPVATIERRRGEGIGLVTETRVLEWAVFFAVPGGDE